MHVSKNTVVSFHYTLADEAGNIVENSRDSDQPNVYLHGAGNILPGLESAIEGKQVGDAVSATLAAQDAFGLHKDNNQQRVPLKYLKHEGKLKIGQQVRLQTEHGTHVGTVIKVGKFNADVDMNHPLAGQTVTFNVDVIEIREATAEEQTHGHAHGPGGHHHH